MLHLFDVLVAAFVALVVMTGIYSLATEVVAEGERTRKLFIARVALINLEGEWRQLTLQERSELFTHSSLCRLQHRVTVSDPCLLFLY